MISDEDAAIRDDKVGVTELAGLGGIFSGGCEGADTCADFADWDGIGREGRGGGVGGLGKDEREVAGVIPNLLLIMSCRR